VIRRRIPSIFLVFFTVVLSTAGCILEWSAMMPTSAPLEPTAPSPPTATPRPTPINVAVAISPTEGPPGTEVQVTVAGFSPETEIELGVGPKNAAYDVVFSPRTNADGSLTTQLAIPVLAKPEEEWVFVASTEGGAVRAVSAPFQVTAPRYEPEIRISPSSGPPGTEVQVVAESFPPDTVVEIGVGRVNSEYDVIATAQTDANGRVNTQITIPDFVEPEDRWVIVVAAEHLPVKVVSDEFDVTQAPTPTASSEDLFTRTNVYLIALGDDGQSGKEIGCDDSVVPVEVEIEPTIAPLTAALEKLLTIDGREYGQSGLHNALYRSDLTLVSASVVDGEAVVRLSGTLTLGGVCDEPRVQAQLRETVLQYDTVDRVSIFVNGSPLEELMRGVEN